MEQKFKIVSGTEKKLTVAMNRLNRHAQKQGYGSATVLSIGKEYEARRLVLTKLEDGEILEKSYAVLVKDVVADIPEQFLNAQDAEWKVIGQIVFAEGLPEVVAESANMAEVSDAAKGFSWKCQTCGHSLRKAFAVKHNVDGKILIVGVECLKQYTGADGQAIIKLVEFISCLLFKEVDDSFGGGGSGHSDLAVIDLEDYLAVCNVIVRRDGQYIKRWNKISDRFGYGETENVEEVNCTRNNAVAQFLGTVNKDVAGNELNTLKLYDGRLCADFRKVQVTPEDKAAAMALVEAWYNAEVPERDGKPDEFIVQCKFLVERGWITTKTAGVAAYMVNGPRKPEGNKDSKHIGVVGERMVFENLKVIFTLSRETEYGMSTILKFEDPSGNVLTWFASGVQNYAKGDVVSLKASIKAHDEYKGVSQTVITRAKAI